MGTFHSQDSSGSCHSDNGMVHPEPSPEKVTNAARTPTDRKRKRKQPASNQSNTQYHPDGNVLGPVGVDGLPTSTTTSGKPSAGKKINDYFRQAPSSPIRPSGPNNPNSGTKSPLPYPSGGAPPGLYPLSPKAQYVGSPSSGVVSGPTVQPGGPINSASSTPPNYETLMQPPKLPAVSKSAQTDMSVSDIASLESQSALELENRDSKIDEIQRLNEELRRQLKKTQKEVDDQKLTITKCLNVVKELLIEKSRIERKEARAKCMQNRLRLGQFVTKRVGATFQENWTDGYAFQELAKRQEEISTEREEIDKKKKNLQKRKPGSEGNGPSRKRKSESNHSSVTSTSDSGVSSSSVPLGSSIRCDNGSSQINGAGSDETMFTRPLLEME